MKPITNNFYKEDSFDLGVFHHSQLVRKTCINILLPVSVTFFPEITVVERLHNSFFNRHILFKELPFIKDLELCGAGMIHTLYYKNGYRVTSLIEYDRRYEICHEIEGDSIFDDCHNAKKAIEKELELKK